MNSMCRLGTSDNLLHTIQEKIKWADTMSEENKKHRKEIEEKVEDAKKSFKVSPMICILFLCSSIGHLHVFDFSLLRNS